MLSALLRQNLLGSLLLRLGLVLALLVGGLLWIFNQTLDEVGDRAQDEILRRQASELLPYIKIAKNDLTLSLPPDLKAVYSTREDGYLYILHDGNGKILAKSHPMAPTLMADALKPVDGATFFTTQGKDGEPDALYMLERRVPSPNGVRYLTVGQNRVIDDVLLHVAGRRSLDKLLFWVFPGFILVLLMVASTVRSSLAPLRRISADVADLGARHPEQKLSTQHVPSEIRPLVDAVNDLLAHLERTLTAQRQLTADTAHQLKTPLAIMRARLELLSDLPGRADLLGDITRMTRLVNQMLQFAELMQNEPVLLPEDLVELAQDVVARMAPLAHQRKVKLSYAGPTLPVETTMNRLLAAEALQNLVDNALQHTPSGKSVVVAVLDNGSVEVRDQGPGIPPEEKNMIFSRFWQGEGRAEGSGLGLAIVAEAMRLHGGSVDVRDGDHGGSVFTLAFGKK